MSAQAKWGFPRGKVSGDTSKNPSEAVQAAGGGACGGDERLFVGVRLRLWEKEAKRSCRCGLLFGNDIEGKRGMQKVVVFWRDVRFGQHFLSLWSI